MGHHATYKCKKCGLSATVSGGADRGMRAFTQTIWCGECKVLQDAVTRRTDSAYGRKSGAWHDVPLRCSQCESEKVQKWQREQPCPACGGQIKVDPKGHLIMWD